MPATYLRTADIPVTALTRYPGNARRGDVTAIRASIRRTGQYRSLVVREHDGALTILAGNHTADALRAEGSPTARCEIIECTDDEALRINLADNKLAELGGYEDADLAALLAGLDGDYDGTGWAAEDLTGLLGTPEPESRTDPDEVPPVPAEPVTRLGDLWELGPHRLLCGDASVPEDVTWLTSSRPADMVLTDPPFVVYGSSSGVGSDVADDKMVRPFFEAMWRTIHANLHEFGHAYVHCDWRSWPAIWESAKRGHMTPCNMLVWDKGSHGMGYSYASTHELIAFFSRLPPQKTMKSTVRAGKRPVRRPNMLRFPRPQGDGKQHNAAKPVGLLRELIVNSSDPGESVLDLYAGSGSTLIAAHAENRVALVMEIEPAYCDVICQRYANHTGITPRLADRAVADTLEV